MSTRQLAILCMACLIAAGCQSDPYVSAHIEMLNAAKRSLEDRVYELEYECEAKARQAERLRTENERLRKEGPPAGGEPEDSISSRPTSKFPPRVPSPRRRLLQNPTIEAEDLRPPTIEPGVPVDPSVIVPAVPSTPPPKPSSDSSAASKSPAPAIAASLGAEDPHITSIYINPDRTKGGDWDGRPGDDGLVLVLEPRNEQDRYIPLAGPVSVVALDPAEPGQQKRFARWDLTSEEVDRQMRQSDSRQGIPLKLPWPIAPPKHEQLRLHVRYVTVDGRQIETSHDVVVNAAARLTRAWTPRPAASQPASNVEAPQAATTPMWTPYR